MRQLSRRNWNSVEFSVRGRAELFNQVQAPSETFKACHIGSDFAHSDLMA